MAYKNTVAIIGATSALGALLAESISASYRLLLMDTEETELTDLQNTLSGLGAEAEIIQCCKEASWEADAVAVLAEEKKLPAIAEKIKAVTTCKPVVHFTALGDTTLAALLPHAKVVTVILDEPSRVPPQSAFVKGEDKEALSFAQSLLTAIGCRQHA